MPERPALEALGVSRRYGERPALQLVDLIVQAGQLHGLLGPNGAGKTTLLRILLGLVRADEGTVRLLDRPLRPGHGLPDGIAGFVETSGFYPYLSGRDNLRLFRRLDARPTPGRGEEATGALERVGLAAQADEAVGGYSAGMRQRLGLAAALLRGPRLLLLDEPTSSLDPAGARDVRALLRELAAQGTTIVLSSHDTVEVEELCSTLTILHHGHVVFGGAVSELRRLSPDNLHALQSSDDDAALRVASGHPGVTIARSPHGPGFNVSADVAALDAYIVALGASGIAVRSLERRTRSLESLFLRLTAHASGDDSSPDRAGGDSRTAW
ncbi:MAG: ABC transporter ATP-binding protein, partial [Acidobacteriota bacterium]